MLSQQEVLRRICEIARNKVNEKLSKVLIKSFMGGLYIAIGASLATICSLGVVDRLGIGIKQLIAGSVFPIGLIAIVLTGVELFTGDCMLLPVAALSKRIKWREVFKLWSLVYIGNFIGSIFWAFLISNSMGGEFLNYAIQIGEQKVFSYVGLEGFWKAFLKGVGCNLLVNLAILLSVFSTEFAGKIIGIWFPIMAFVALGFEHSVANMYFIPVAIFTGSHISWFEFLFYNLFPVTFGNILGGFVFIGLVYWYLYSKD